MGVSRRSWVAIFVVLLITVFCAWGMFYEAPKHQEKGSYHDELVVLEEKTGGAEEWTRYVEKQISALEKSFPKPKPTSTPKPKKK